jgi:hypothetical protein
MSLGLEQEAFAEDLVTLIQHIRSLGYKIRLGEVWRPLEMQEIYVKTGRSKTMNSEHIKKCAADLVILTDGKILNRAETKPIGDFWESLSPKNRWGGNWRGLVDSGKSRFVDVPHFERKT